MSRLRDSTSGVPPGHLLSLAETKCETLAVSNWTIVQKKLKKKIEKKMGKKNDLKKSLGRRLAVPSLVTLGGGGGVSHRRGSYEMLSVRQSVDNCTSGLTLPPYISSGLT